MSRKDYEVVAATLKDSYVFALRTRDHAATGVLHALTFNLADAFEKDNPRFDRERFVRAVGLMPLDLGPDHEEGT